MTKHTEVYSDCTISINDDEGLTIDDKEIDYQYDPVAAKWSSRYLPYVDYDSLLELARDVVRNSEEFVSPKN